MQLLAGLGRVRVLASSPAAQQRLAGAAGVPPLPPRLQRPAERHLGLSAGTLYAGTGVGVDVRTRAAAFAAASRMAFSAREGYGSDSSGDSGAASDGAYPYELEVEQWEEEAAFAAEVDAGLY